ncbi:MAG: glycosyltransferase family 39 protein [Chloroflexi bacterium]|nr:glycosyltransferase family 39 protein [Chloroflexota bacterium]
MPSDTPAAQTSSQPASTDSLAPTIRWWTDALVLAAIVGVCLGVRIWLNIRSDWMIDGDEALFGIGAERILRGQFPVFLYGVPYMGVIQSYLAAPFIAVFGPRPAALRVATLIEAMVLVMSTWHLARLLYDRRTALCAALFAALPTLYVASQGLKVWGSYVGIMALGTEVAAVCWWIRQHPSTCSARVWFVVGVLTGVAVWSNDLVIYYLATAVIVLPWRKVRLWILRAMGGFLPGLALGGAPLWLYNLQHAGATLRFLLEGSGAANPEYAAVTRILVKQLLPHVIGWSDPWQTGRAAMLAGPVVAAIALSGLVFLFWDTTLAALCHRSAQRIIGSSWPLACFVVIVFLVYLVSGFGRPSLGPFDASGRYLLPLWTAAAIGSGALITRVGKRWRLLGAMILCFYGVAVLLTYRGSNPRLVFQSPYWSNLPLDNRPLVQWLEKSGITEVWMNHWAGDVVMYLSDERIKAADYYDIVVGHGIDRFPSVFVDVSRSAHTAFVVIAPGDPHPPLEAILRARGVPFDQRVIGPYHIFAPTAGRVDPQRVVTGLRYPY